MKNEYDINPVDLYEIERRAHEMRAQVARDGAKAFGRWMRAKVHGLTHPAGRIA